MRTSVCSALLCFAVSTAASPAPFGPGDVQARDVWTPPARRSVFAKREPLNAQAEVRHEVKRAPFAFVLPEGVDTHIFGPDTIENNGGGNNGLGRYPFFVKRDGLLSARDIDLLEKRKASIEARELARREAEELAAREFEELQRREAEEVAKREAEEREFEELEARYFAQLEGRYSAPHALGKRQFNFGSFLNQLGALTNGSANSGNGNGNGNGAGGIFGGNSAASQRINSAISRLRNVFSAFGFNFRREEMERAMYRRDESSPPLFVLDGLSDEDEFADHDFEALVSGAVGQGGSVSFGKRQFNFGSFLNQLSSLTNGTGNGNNGNGNGAGGVFGGNSAASQRINSAISRLRNVFSSFGFNFRRNEVAGVELDVDEPTAPFSSAAKEGESDGESHSPAPFDFDAFVKSKRS